MEPRSASGACSSRRTRSRCQRGLARVHRRPDSCLGRWWIRRDGAADPVAPGGLITGRTPRLLDLQAQLDEALQVEEGSCSPSCSSRAWSAATAAGTTWVRSRNSRDLPGGSPGIRQRVARQGPPHQVGAAFLRVRGLDLAPDRSAVSAPDAKPSVGLKPARVSPRDGSAEVRGAATAPSRGRGLACGTPPRRGQRRRVESEPGRSTP